MAAAAILSLATPASAQSFTKIADSQTVVPGGTGTFSLFADARAFENGKVAFIAYDSGSGSGVFRYQNGVLDVVANTTTTVPGTAATFNSFFDVALDGPFVAFTAGWPGPGGGCAFSGSEGLFGGRFDGGAIRAVATTLTTPNHCLAAFGSIGPFIGSPTLSAVNSRLSLICCSVRPSSVSPP